MRKMTNGIHNSDVSRRGEFLQKFSCTQKVWNETSPEILFPISHSVARKQVLNTCFARGKSNLKGQI